MIDPISLATIIGVIATFLLNIYQSVKSRHFHSECMGCKVDYTSEHHDNDKK